MPVPSPCDRGTPRSRPLSRRRWGPGVKTPLRRRGPGRRTPGPQRSSGGYPNNLRTPDLWPRKIGERARGAAQTLRDPSIAQAQESALSVLLRQPGGFDGFRMSQKVADANDLPCSKVEDFADFLTELDAGHPGGQVEVTEREDRLAEVAELLGPIGEAFPRVAAVLPPNLSRAVMTSVGSCLSLEARLDRRVPLDVGIELRPKRCPDHRHSTPRRRAGRSPRLPATSPTPRVRRLQGRDGARGSPPPDQLAVAVGGDARDRVVGIHAASSGTDAEPAERQYAIIEVAHLVEGRLEHLKVLGVVREEPAKTRVPVVGAFDRAPSGDPNHILAYVIEDRVDVPAAQRVNPFPEPLDVLLRHRVAVSRRVRSRRERLAPTGRRLRGPLRVCRTHRPWRSGYPGFHRPR